MLALQSVSLRKNGEPKNPVLRAYYLEKCKTKAKMTALGAIIHKLCNIIFAVLRDETPFVLISPLEHCRKYSSISQAARAFATSFLRPCGASAFLYLWGTTTLFTCFLQQPLDFS